MPTLCHPSSRRQSCRSRKAAHGRLRKVLTGLQDTEKGETYIQSGNAVVDAKGSAAKVAQAVAAGLEKLMGAPCGVVVRTHEQMDRADPRESLCCRGSCERRLRARCIPGRTSRSECGSRTRSHRHDVSRRRDRYHSAGDALYLHLPDGAAETKFSGKTLDKASWRDGNRAQLEHGSETALKYRSVRASGVNDDKIRRSCLSRSEHGICDTSGFDCRKRIVHTNDRRSVQNCRNQRRDAGDFARLDRGCIAAEQRSQRVTEE